MSGYNSKLLIDAACTGNAVEVARLIPILNPDIHLQNRALTIAVKNNHVDCVAQLITGSHPPRDHSFALRWAAALGHLECVKRLIPVSDPDEGLAHAIEENHFNCVEVLIPACTTQKLSEGFEWAIKYGRVSCVEALLPYADARVFEGRALYLAALSGSNACVDFLYDKCKPRVALANLKREYPDQIEHWGHLYNTIQADTISKHISVPHCLRARKM